LAGQRLSTFIGSLSEIRTLHFCHHKSLVFA